MSMNPDPQGQRPGLFGRIGNFFGAGDPNAGQPTDPFANLSRAQRTMLGFAALRDAAASLEGRDSNYFAQAMGGFESARERERLREQGIFQNQVGALQALAQIEQQIALAQSYGMPVSPAMTQMRDMLMGTLGQGGAMPAGGTEMPMQPPGDFTGGVVPQGLPSGPQGVTGAPPTNVVYEPGSAVPQPYDGEPEIVQTGGEPMPADPLAQLNASDEEILQQMRFRLSQGGDVRDLQFRLDQNQLAREQLQAEQLAQQQAAEAEQQEADVAEAQRSRMQPLIDDALGFILDDQGRVRTTTSQIGSVSGFGAGLMPGVTAAQARLANAAVTELGAIAAMNSVREAREAGFGGSLSDADILLIQRSGGTFDLGQPEATARTLRRLQQELSGGGTGISEDDQALIDRYTR